jgi:hypothetical protein
VYSRIKITTASARENNNGCRLIAGVWQGYGKGMARVSQGYRKSIARVSQGHRKCDGQQRHLKDENPNKGE